MDDFIEKFIFPGGELLHVGAVLEHLARSGLEMVDTENLRPHYARTLWDWSDALEATLDAAREVLARDGGADRAEKTLRAYRLYLAGSAMSFKQGLLSLHQVLATSPSGQASAAAARREPPHRSHWAAGESHRNRRATSHPDARQRRPHTQRYSAEAARTGNPDASA